MWQLLGVLALFLGGVGLLSWGAYMEHKHVLWKEERDNPQPPPILDEDTQELPVVPAEEPAPMPMAVLHDEMRAMGWEPLDDGSGLWKLTMDGNYASPN